MKKYCTECGTKLTEYVTGKFDGTTGGKINSLRCENIRCQDGCLNITGHSSWQCWRNRCANCGYSINDY